MITMDHSRNTEGCGPNALGGNQCIGCAKDRALNVGYVGLTNSTDGEAVAYHIRHAIGHDTIGMVYTDGGSGMIRACHLLRLNDDRSTPEVNDPHAIAGRYVQDVQDGMRVRLCHAGRPAACWPDAANCFVMLSNIIDMAPTQDYFPSMTKWHARTKAPFKGQALSCGCAVSDLPTQLREITGKAAPRTKLGIGVGDCLQTTATWSGE